MVLKSLKWGGYLPSVLSVFTLLILSHASVLFFGKTFQSSATVAGVMPDGPYGAHPQGSAHAYGVDLGGSGWQIESETVRMGISLREGEFPFWNPNQMMGTPLFHNLQLASGFFPRLLVAWANGGPFARDVYTFFLFLLCAGGMFAFCWEMGLAPSASGLGALAYSLSGFVITFSNFTFTESLALLPWAFWGTLRVAERPCSVHLLALILPLTGMLVSIYPAPSFLMLVFLSAFGAFLAWKSKARAGDSRVALRLLTAYTIAIMLSSFAWLPELRLLMLCENARPAGLGLGSEPLFSAAALWFPKVLWHIPGAESTLGWVGAIAASLAAFAVLNSFKLRREGVQGARHFAFFAVAGSVCLLKMFGIPPVQWVAYLPGFDRVGYARYVQPEIMFCLAVLAAIGMAALLQFKVQESRRGLLRILGVLLGLSWVCVMAAGQSKIEDMVHAQGLLKIVGWTLLLWGCFAVAVRRARTPEKLARTALIFCALELVAASQMPRVDRADAYRKAPYLDFLQALPPARLAARDLVLYPPTASAFNLDDIRWMNALFLPHYKRFMSEFIDPGASDRAVGDNLRVYEGASGINPFLSLTNTRYLLTQTPYREVPGLKKIYDHEIKIYENLQGLPRAFFVSEIVGVKNADEAVSAMRKVDFKRVAIVEAPPPWIRAFALQKKNGQEDSNVTLTRVSGNRVEGRVHAPVAGFVILSDTFYPAWTARVDGRRTPIFRANLNFRAIFVEPGDHTFLFAYQDFTFWLGVGLGTLGLILLLSLFWRQIPGGSLRLFSR